MKQEVTQELKGFIRDYVKDMHTVFPGKIISFDAAKCEAHISPTAKYWLPDGTQIDFPEIFEVPVFFPQGFGQEATIVFPVKPGDECLIFVSEQALDLWRTGADSPTDLRFDMTSAIALVGLFRQPNPLVRRACDNESVILQRGNTFIEIYPNKIHIASTEEVNTNTREINTFASTINTEANDISTLASAIRRALPFINEFVDGQASIKTLTMQNPRNGRTTISVTFNGERGTINMTTFDPDTGVVTGTFGLP